MKAAIPRSNKKPFLERIANFDWEKRYTPWVRVGCHLMMWLLFTCMLQMNLFFDSALPFDQASAFAVRTLLCNISIFYLFFYVAIPNTLLKNRLLPAIVSFVGCLYLWMIMNHYLLIIIYKHFNVHAPYYTRGLKSNYEETFLDLLSLRNLLVSIVPMMYTISPFFFTKIVFSIMRFYSIWFKSETRALSLEKEKISLEMEKVNLEKDFLKSQLNPHFLFNTLNNLYGLSIEKDDRTPEVITQLSEMLRYTLYESNGERVPVDKELGYLQNYILLEKMRYNNDRDIEFHIDDGNGHNPLIAPLLTFTFVENAFKYGLKKRKGGFLKINIKIAHDLFYFSIVNDKQENQKSAEFGGIGLDNARKRLDLLYPGKHSLNIDDQGKTFNVELRVNLN